MSKQNKFLISVASLLGLVLFIWVLNPTVKESKKEENVLAQINELYVTTAHFENAFKEYYYRTGQVLSPDITTKKAILDTEFNTYVLAVHATDLGLDKTESVIQQKKAIHKRVLTEEYLNQVILSDVEVKNEDLEEYFIRFNTQLKASHLYASSLEESESFYKRLKAGESFEELAKESFTNGYLSQNGGDIGRFTTDELDISFEERAFKMKVGEISEPVKTAQGYSIIKLTDRVTKPILTEYEFNQKKNQLFSYALKKKKELETRAHLSNFINGVNINNDLLEKLSDQIADNFEGMLSKNPEFVSNLSKGGVLIDYQNFQFTMQDFKEEYLVSSSQMLNTIYNKESLSNFMIGLAYRSMLLEGAKEAGIEDQKLVQESISETYYHFLARQVNNELRASISNTGAELYNEFQKNIENFAKPLEINFSRIVLSSREEAESVLRKARNDGSFEELVKTYTTSKEDRFTNGELGFESIKSYGFIGLDLAKLNVNEISEVIKYQENEYHIYKCLGRIEAATLSFDQAKERVDDFLTKKKLKQLVASTIIDVKKKHNAVIDIEKLKELTIQI